MYAQSLNIEPENDTFQGTNILRDNFPFCKSGIYDMFPENDSFLLKGGFQKNGRFKVEQKPPPMPTRSTGTFDQLLGCYKRKNLKPFGSCFLRFLAVNLPGCTTFINYKRGAFGIPKAAKCCVFLAIFVLANNDPSFFLV